MIETKDKKKSRVPSIFSNVGYTGDIKFEGVPFRRYSHESTIKRHSTIIANLRVKVNIELSGEHIKSISLFNSIPMLMQQTSNGCGTRFYQKGEWYNSYTLNGYYKDTENLWLTISNLTATVSATTDDGNTRWRILMAHLN